MIHSMIVERNFQISMGSETSLQVFPIKNGLQQGTINSPILFNIFTSDILKLFGPDNTACNLIAFADDLIVYKSDYSPRILKSTLQAGLNKIFAYYKAWKLRVNASKCESILIRPSCRKASGVIRSQYKHFSLRSEEDVIKNIENKNAVRYLGLLIDERFLFNKHIETRIKKAKSAFMANARLFYSKKLHSKVKLTCYQLLVRPVITYGCETWYNMGASIMEEIRIFERRCLRVCLNLYRTRESNYLKYAKKTPRYIINQVLIESITL